MRDEVQGAQTNDNGGGFSTKKTSSGMPSLGKGKGYVSAVGSDDHGIEMGGEGLSGELASAATDEILGMETPIVPQSRHKGKKVCLGLMLVVLLLAGGAAAAAAGKGGGGDGEARVRRRVLFAPPSQRSLPRDAAAPSRSSVVESFAP